MFFLFLVVDIVLFGLGVVIGDKVSGSNKQLIKKSFVYLSYFLLVIGIVSFIISCVIYWNDPDTLYATGRYGSGIVHHSNPYAPWFRRIGIAVTAFGLGSLVGAVDPFNKSKK